MVDWPRRYLERTTVDERTAICVLTHDPKFDIPLLRRALTLPVGYVGAMGSRRTHEDRLRLLDEAGVTAGQLAALHSPIGLDLGARTPEETAVSITAEIIAHTNGAAGLPLSQRTGPIHRTTPHHAPNHRPTRPGRGYRPPRHPCPRHTLRGRQHADRAQSGATSDASSQVGHRPLTSNLVVPGQLAAHD